MFTILYFSTNCVNFAMMWQLGLSYFFFIRSDESKWENIFAMRKLETMPRETCGAFVKRTKWPIATYTNDAIRKDHKYASRCFRKAWTNKHNFDINMLNYNIPTAYNPFPYPQTSYKKTLGPNKKSWPPSLPS